MFDNMTSDELKVALESHGQQSAQYARTGPKKFEDALHDSANVIIDELEARGDL
jgi:hypothetical protein